MYNISIIFIGVGRYAAFFERFYRSVERFLAPNSIKTFFVFSDNPSIAKYSNCNVIHTDSTSPRDIKLSKFKYIESIAHLISHSDAVMYFDADSYLKKQISSDIIKSWFLSNTYVGVLHPWTSIRDKDAKFESSPISTAYISKEDIQGFKYHQSCFWACRGADIVDMSRTINSWIQDDIKIKHVNQHNICDEIYVNKFFFKNRGNLTSIGSEYANPGEQYERITSTPDRPGHRFKYDEVIIHDNAHQTHSFNHIHYNNSNIGAYYQLYKRRLSAYTAVEQFRHYYPDSPIYICSDGGDDFKSLADKFNCSYNHFSFNCGSWRNRHAHTNQYKWLMRLYDAATSTLKDVEWIVLLEEDVETLNSILYMPKFNLSGPRNGPEWNSSLRGLFESKHGDLDKYNDLGKKYTGCGGSIINRKVFVECFEKTSYNDIRACASLDSRILLAEDATITALFHLNGYDTGGWDDFIGSSEHDYARKHLYAFAHSNKQHFNLPYPTLV